MKIKSRINFDNLLTFEFSGVVYYLIVLFIYILVTLVSPTRASFAGYIIGAKDQATLNNNIGRFTNSATGKILPCGSSVLFSLMIYIYYFMMNINNHNQF